MYNNPADAARFDVEDFAAAFIRLEGDIILDFRIAWAMHLDTPGDTVILGTKGALRIPSTECWNGSVGGPMTLYHDVAGKQVQTTIPLCSPVHKGLFYNKIRSFLDAIINGGEAPVPTSQILYNQAIIDAIVKSARIGKEIEIEIPEI
jgi:predicted dehydrogenase